MTDLLDSSIVKKTVHDGFSNFADRLRHIFVDGIIIIALSMVMEHLLNTGHLFSEFGNKLNVIAFMLRILVAFFYYTLMEYFLGYTLGKFLNKTRVVSFTGEKPNFIQIVLRTLIRIIPFGFLTIVTPYKAFLHDILTKTRVVRIKKKRVVRVNEI